MPHIFTVALECKRPVSSGPRPGAWLVPSRSLQPALQKLLSATPDPERFEFFWMPAEDPAEPGSALLVIPAPDRRLRILPGAAPYHRIFPDRDLFVPAGSALSASLDPAELDRLFPAPVTVFHPRLGPVLFRDEDRLGILDLYAFPEIVTGDFHQAHPGIPASPESLSIEPAATALDALTKLLRLHRGRHGAASKLHPLRGDQSESWPVRVGRAAGLTLLGGFHSAGGLPDEEPAHGWLRRLRQWAGRQLLDLQRERDCEQLIQFLRQDPETALRHAPPIPASARRPNPPSSVARSSGSSARHAGSSSLNPRKEPELPLHPAWVLDWRDRAALIAAYRETAQRECGLGRRLNAAYIHAELLHDYRAAALVLRQGGYFREAAVVYQKHLGLPFEAARCLLEGRLYREAALLFERQHEHLSAAEAWTLLGDAHNARLAYHRAVDRCVCEENFIEAAHVLAVPLESPNDAIELLAQRWPGARDAETCLLQELRLRSESGDASALRQRLEEVAEVPAPLLAPALVRLLAAFAQTPADPSAKTAALDCAWSLAARTLRRPHAGVREQLLKALPSLEPGDRLLQRDAARFLAEVSNSSITTKVDRTARLPCIDRLELPHRVRWRCFVPRGNIGFCAAGFDAHDSLTLLRGSWEGSLQTARIPALADPSPNACFRFALAWDTSPEILSVPGTGSGWNVCLPASGDLRRPFRAENPVWIDRPGFLGMTFTPQRVAWVLSRENDDLVLFSFSPLGDLIACRSLGLGAPALDFPVQRVPIPMIYVRGQLFFAAGDRLARFYRDQLSVHAAPAAIRDLAVSPPGAPVRVAALLERGAAVFGTDDLWDIPQILPLDEPGLYAGFTLAGSVLAALPGHLELFRLHEREPRSVAHASVSDDPPLGVFATDRDSVLAVATEQHVRFHSL